MEINQKLGNLLSQPEAVRDEKWETEVLGLLPQAAVKIISDQPNAGPDGWPYLFVEMGATTQGEPATNVLHWLSEQGVGLVINPQKYTPDYVLPYGMIWNQRQTGKFMMSNPVTFSGLESFEISEGVKIQSGPPAEDFWPKYARTIVAGFLSQQNVLKPEVLVISQDKVHYDLCFSLESFGNPPKAEHQGILEALSWFFPAHYTIALVNQQGLPPFHLLSEL